MAKRAKSKKAGKKRMLTIRRGLKPRVFNPLPDKLRVTLSYVQNNIFSTTTSASRQLFRGNSIYDPDYTGSGHQQLFRDQYALLYNRYIVLSSSIKVEVVCPYTNQCMQCCVYPQPDDVTTASTVDIDAEKPRARSVICNGGGPSRVMKHTMSTGKLYGQTITTSNWDDTFQSQFTTNPSNSWFWVVSCQNPDLTTASACTAIISMSFDVILFDRIRQSQS